MPPLEDSSLLLVSFVFKRSRKHCGADDEIALTKNGITKLGSAPALDLSKYETDKKITDEEVLKILEQPLARNTGKKNKSKKKKPAKKEGEKEEE